MKRYMQAPTYCLDCSEPTPDAAEKFKIRNRRETKKLEKARIMKDTCIAIKVIQYQSDTIKSTHPRCNPEKYAVRPECYVMMKSMLAVRSTFEERTPLQLEKAALDRILDEDEEKEAQDFQHRASTHYIDHTEETWLAWSHHKVFDYCIAAMRRQGPVPLGFAKNECMLVRGMSVWDALVVLLDQVSPWREISERWKKMSRPHDYIAKVVWHDWSREGLERYHSWEPEEQRFVFLSATMAECRPFGDRNLEYGGSIYQKSDEIKKAKELASCKGLYHDQ